MQEMDGKTMIEFLNEIVNYVNLPVTMLLIMMLLYWLMIMVGVFGFDSFDFDFDADADIALDGDIGIDADGDFGVDTSAGSPEAASTSFSGSTTSGNEGAFRAVFEYFYLGEVPIVIIASFFVFYWWILTIITNHFWNADQQLLTSLLFLVPNVFISMMAMRYTMIPFAVIFRKPEPENKTRETLLGMIGVVKTSEITDSFGQIEVQRKDDVEIILNVRTSPGKKLGKGDAAKIVSYDHSDGTFLVELAKWEKN